MKKKATPETINAICVFLCFEKSGIFTKYVMAI